MHLFSLADSKDDIFWFGSPLFRSILNLETSCFS
uniref:Uncharacterized protein n=1 Tax=Rhizophora mucronata TaxID=61149 RepID=A0A2P2Q8K2_RHIMU